MLRKVLIFCMALLAVCSAPAPFYSLVETPTSRFEQKFLLSSPQLHEAYKVQPQQVRPHSEFQFPQQQQVLYYYPENSVNQQVAQNNEQFSYKVIGENYAPVQPQHNQQVVHYQPYSNDHTINQQPRPNQPVHYQNLPNHPLNLHQVRQDTPWWQNIWNQVVNPEAEKEEIKEETDLTSRLEDTSSVNNSSMIKIEIAVEEARANGSEEQFIDNSANAEISEETATEQLEHVELRVDETKAEDEDCESVAVDSNEQSATSSSETEETSTETIETETSAGKIESTTFEATPAPELVSTTHKQHPVSDTKIKISKPTPQKDQQESIYVHYPEQQERMSEYYQRYYVAHGPPQFYGSIDPNALIFSIQQLQPVVRTTGIKAGEEEKVTRFSMSSATEPSSTLRIHVVDEARNTAPEQVSTRPQLPAEEQSSMMLKREMETLREDKREQSVIGGESTQIHSD